MEEDQRQQRHQAAQQGDKAEDEGRRVLPKREVDHDAGGGEVQVHSRRQLGVEEVPRRKPAGRLGREEGHGGVELVYK